MSRYKRIMRRIIQKRRSGKDRQTAVFETIGETTRKRFGIKEEPKRWSESQKALILKKTTPFYSRSHLLERIAAKLSGIQTRKKKRIQKLFSSENLGMVLIRPEMYSHSHKIRAWLEQLGCQVFFAKTIVLGKKQAFKLYGDTIKKYKSSIPYLPILQQGPSRIIVFRHLPPQEYIQRSKYLHFLRQSDPKKYAMLISECSGKTTQEIFNLVIKGQEDWPGTMRAVLTLQEIGSSVIKQISPQAKPLDAFHYFSNVGEAIRAGTFRGIHSPDTFERLVLEAVPLLTSKDLDLIEGKIKH